MTVIIASRQARPWGTGEGHAGLSKLYRRMGKLNEAHEHHYRDDDVPRDGHALLAGAGGG